MHLRFGGGDSIKYDDVSREVSTQNTKVELESNLVAELGSSTASLDVNNVGTTVWARTGVCSDGE